jgi:malonate decarboxylase alpha subunit
MCGRVSRLALERSAHGSTVVRRGGGRRVSESTWTRRRAEKRDRLAAVAPFIDGKLIDPSRLGDALEALLRPGDRVALEGDNQKQADFLSRTLAQCDPGKVNGLHMLISSVSRPEHLDLFEKKIAATLDLAYAGPQSVRIAQMVEDGQVRIGAIHTYVELYARMFTDLSPNVALLCATKADRDGNLFTGPNTEDTPTIAEAAAFRDGVVLVQADEIVDSGELPRVDIPGDWVDLVVEADRPFALEPLFTRDPRLIGPVEILKAMIAIRGVYERHEVTSLNHGIGFDTAAIELLLPTYGDQLGLKGRIAKHWTLNPHPTLIPAIESGWVESIHSSAARQGWSGTPRPAPTCSSPDGTDRCGPIGCCVSWQANTRSTCSSDPHCRSTAMRTRRPSPTAGCPGSAAHRTWATTHTVAGTRLLRG